MIVDSLIRKVLEIFQDLAIPHGHPQFRYAIQTVTSL